jgi:hypothetical protein
MKYIEKIVEDVIQRIEKELSPYLEVGFVTGSYVRKKYSLDEPNVNIYLFAKKGHYEYVNLTYSKILNETIKFWKDKVEIFIDLHPYLYSVRTSSSALPRISFTTNVFDGSAEQNRFNMPSNIGNGWNKSYRIICNDEKVLNSLKNIVTKNESWWLEREFGFRLYKHQLEALPHVYNYTDRPLLLFREALHYAEEVIRDGVGIKLENRELESGEDLNIIHNWRERLISFYKDRYSPETYELVYQFEKFKFSTSEYQQSLEGAEKCYIWAIEVIHALNKELYQEKLNEEVLLYLTINQNKEMLLTL